MNLKRHPSIVPVAALVALALSATPALAAQHRSTGSRSAPARSAPARQAVPRTQSAPARPASPSRVYSSPQRVGPPQVAPQRGYQTPRVVAPQRNGVAVQRAPVPSRRFEQGRRPIHQPYYSFRPRFTIGLGFFIGYPVAYPYGYSYGYGYPYGSSYGYSYGSPYYGYSSPYNTYGYPVSEPGSGYVSAAPGSAAVGGVSLEIDPPEAAVFLDGVYVGTVGDFSPTEQPLTLAAGKHHVEFKAQGYVSMAFDVTVVAGQVTPFQGTMQVIR
jgi:hypothetical protein